MKFLSILFVFGLIATTGCSADVSNRKPVGETFPTVQGTALNGDSLLLPRDVLTANKPVVLIVAYDQNAQFDVDRWLLGLLQADLKVGVYEVPTVAGVIPGMIAGTIDEGMRGGIPPEDWAVVVTVYDDAEKIVEFTGNEKGQNARVLLLDGTGKVLWFHDEGYSARELLDMKALVAP